MRQNVKAARHTIGYAAPPVRLEAYMEYTREELEEAKRQIDSTLHKLRETVRTLEAKVEPRRYRSQITLAKRRIKAFTIAGELIDRELEM